MSALSDQIKLEYIDALTSVGETISIRRYSGSGDSRTFVDYSARARVVGFEPHQLSGTIIEGDRKLIVFSDDLVTAGLTLPVRIADKAVVRGKEIAIIAVDDSTRRVSGELIAHEIQARG